MDRDSLIAGEQGGLSGTEGMGLLEDAGISGVRGREYFGGREYSWEAGNPCRTCGTIYS